MLDITLLSSAQVGLVFLALLFGICGCALVLWLQPAWLRVPGTSPYYAGIVVLGSIIGINLFFEEYRLRLIGLVLAGILAFVGGRRDETRAMSPLWQLGWQVVMAVVVVGCGWTIPYISHPFQEGIIRLDWIMIGPWIIPGSIVAVLFLVVLMNALNFFDGIDGLAGSVSGAAFITLAGISLLPATQDPTTLRLSLIGLGVIVGFLVWNWSPARVYLGTSGIWFLGIYLGMTAMVGGGKIATTILVLALPLIDAIWVTVERYRHGQSIWRGDRKHHLHFRLLTRGFTPTQIVCGVALLSLGFGLIAISTQPLYKLSFLIIIALIFVGVGGTLLRLRPNS